MLVNDPSFSVWAAQGKKKTSVGMSLGLTSPRSISGASRQKSADSITEKSRTTSQSSLRIAARWRAPCIEPTVGFSPIRKYPLTTPSAMAVTVVMCEWSPERRGRVS